MEAVLFCDSDEDKKWLKSGRFCEDNGCGVKESQTWDMFPEMVCTFPL